MQRRLITALTCLFPSLAVAAPALLPTRDVSVSYSLSTPGQAPQTLQFSYNAAQERARVSSPYGYYVLADLPAGQAQLIVPALHAIIQAPDFSALAAELFSAANNAHFTALGKAHYAGRSCEMYLITDKSSTARACLTPDGITLRFSGHDAHGSAEMTAIAVDDAPQPADQFTAPTGLMPLTLPPDALRALLTPQS